MYPATTKAGGVNVTAGPLDVCKTPSPGGPIPIPYANMVDGLARGGDKAAKRTQKKIIREAARKNQNVPTATAAAIFSQSMGDEAGTARGIVSGKTMPGTKMTMHTGQHWANAPGHTLAPSQTKLMILGDSDSDD